MFAAIHTPTSVSELAKCAESADATFGPMAAIDCLRELTAALLVCRLSRRRQSSLSISSSLTSLSSLRWRCAAGQSCAIYTALRRRAPQSSCQRNAALSMVC
eukprot:4478053-Pleurochrysis_carterae.AAC.1